MKIMFLIRQIKSEILFLLNVMASTREPLYVWMEGSLLGRIETSSNPGLQEGSLLNLASCLH